MPLPLNALTALAAAAAWGGGDFCGGMGVKAAGGTTTGALRVIVVAHGVSLVALLGAIALLGGVWPNGALLLWGLLAGIAGALALTAFYIALSRGAMGASAAISGLLAAAVPAIVSSATEGAPDARRIVGFLLAAAAIWLIAAGPSPQNATDATRTKDRQTTALAIFAGLGFAVYLVAMRMDNLLGVVEPMVLARSTSLLCCTGVLLVLQRQQRTQKIRPQRTPWLSRTALLGALGVAVLDTGGNMLFTASTRLGRLDVAAVLASLYPAGTILLAAWRLQEKPTRRQTSGMVIALAAVLLIVI